MEIWMKLENCLVAFAKKWSRGKKLELLTTCGGCVQGEWPQSVTKEDGGNGNNPNQHVVDLLVEEAKKCVKQVLQNGLDKKLSQITNYLTFGIDSFKSKISLSQNYIGQPHIELVIITDLVNKKFHVTGKSYPTSGQEGKLVRITDLDSHFIKLMNGDKVMVFGCHDLMMCSNRNWDNTGKFKRKIKEEFRNKAMKESPQIAIQHPHTTDSIRTWGGCWGTLKRMFPTLKNYAGSGTYYNPDRPVRDELHKVLEKTKGGKFLDIIVRHYGI